MLMACTQKSACVHASNIVGVNATLTVMTKSANIDSNRCIKAHVSTNAESCPRRPKMWNMGSSTIKNLIQYQQLSTRNLTTKLKLGMV